MLEEAVEGQMQETQFERGDLFVFDEFGIVEEADFSQRFGGVPERLGELTPGLKVWLA